MRPRDGLRLRLQKLQKLLQSVTGIKKTIIKKPRHGISKKKLRNHATQSEVQHAQGTGGKKRRHACAAVSRSTLAAAASGARVAPPRAAASRAAYAPRRAAPTLSPELYTGWLLL